MAWKITRDLICEGHGSESDYPSRVGYGEEHTRIPVEAAVLGFESEPLPTGSGPHNIRFVTKFRLYDDDGDLYYEGELDDDDECLNQQAALKWGAAAAGCTTIKVLRGGEWKQEIA